MSGKTRMNNGLGLLEKRNGVAGPVEYVAPPPQAPDVSDCIFYHYIDLPGVGEVGRCWDLRPTIDAYLGRLDYRGQRALDVGTASGYLTFALEARGARVVSFDIEPVTAFDLVPYALPQFDPGRLLHDHARGALKVRNAYWLTHRLLRSSACVYYGDIYDLPTGLGAFDVVVLGMVLPHLRDPFRALCSACRLSRDYVVVTQQALGGDEPFAYFMPNVRKDPGNLETYHGWWVYSEVLLRRMLEVLGFTVVSSERVKHRCADPTRQEPMYEECLTLVARRA
jgi:SAM-dependent methyltransferase